MRNLQSYLCKFIIGLSILLFFSCSATDDTSDLAAPVVVVDETTDDNTTDEDTTNNDEPLAALTLSNVSYGNNPQQVYDLYLPEVRLASKTKIIVLIHGGGWTSGDKEDMQTFVNYFLENHPDHAVLNLNYVLAQVTGPTAFPNQYLDIQTALNQIISQSEELQVLPEFGFLGTSAGAHLGMMYDYTYDSNDLVKFVINIVGPSDFTDPFYANDPNFEIALALLVDENQFPAGTDYSVANSPALVVNELSSPTLLFYGDQDPLVPLSNGQTLSDSLSILDIDNTFTIYEGGHGDDWSAAAILDLSIKTDNYVNTYLAID